MSRKSCLAATVFLGLSAMVVGLWSAIGRPSFVKPREKFVIADVPRPAFGLLYVAQAQGYFREQGIDVTLVPAKSSGEALDWALAGKADLANIFEITAIQKHLAGAAVRAVAAVSSSQKNTALVARKDRGIQSLEDLKGKRIGVTKNSNGDFFLYLLLTGGGIQPSTVTLIDIPAEDLPLALKAGRVDAVATWQPLLTNAQAALGQDSSVTFYSDLYSQIGLLAGHPKVIAEKKGAVTALLRGIVKAERFMRAHREHGNEIMSRYLSEALGETIRYSWDDYRFELKLSNVMLNLFSQRMEWLLRKHSGNTAAPDLRQLIFTDYLREVAPQAVTIRNTIG
jgi:ABC-type nitrate/sulfonate/bicarbonate transport system substrate-binding protein